MSLVLCNLGNPRSSSSRNTGSDQSGSSAGRLPTSSSSSALNRCVPSLPRTSSSSTLNRVAVANVSSNDNNNNNNDSNNNVRNNSNTFTSNDNISEEVTIYR